MNKDTYSFTKTAEGITEPTEVLGPEPSKGACTKTLVKGCRALTFNYATSKTASGEGPGQWGDYVGRLTRVYLTAWDPAKGEMSAPITVAQYAYDSKGRLRAEWDPRLEPTPLKTTYGYDSEEHVTSVTPAGQQPWLIHYGATVGDPVTGRALSVTRPAATTVAKLKERDEKSVPAVTVAPTLSTSGPTIGTTMSVSSAGTWSNEPLAYAYQWQRCSTTGGECTIIEGATNKTYTPQPRDGGYTLNALVAATNADGTVTAATAATSVIPITQPLNGAKVPAVGCKGGGLKNPAGVTFTGTEVWVADTGDACIAGYSVEGGSPHETCTEGLVSPAAIAVAGSNIYVADPGTNTIVSFGVTCQHVVFAGGLNDPTDVVVDPGTKNVWVADAGENAVKEYSPEGALIATFNAAGNESYSEPTGIAFSNGALYVADRKHNRVVIASTTGGYLGQFGTGGSGKGQFWGPVGITTDPVSGDLIVTDTGNNRIERFNPAGTYIAQYGSTGSGELQLSEPRSIAVDPSGNMYIADTANSRIQKWGVPYVINNPAPAAPVSSGESIWTVDYQIPLLGSGLPELANCAKWGEKAGPVKGTAIFPPDEPMGWPAASYKRATITYLDKLDRAVNTALPGGGISTTEYDEQNNITRALTADNRAIAVAAGELNEQGTKIKERAEQLDTKNSYAEGGTELSSTTGPEHLVKIAATGKQEQARKNVRYYYDENAPAEGRPYRLVTKTIEGASVGHGENELDARTITDSYNGQGNLGWKLHAPTAVSTSTGTQTLTTQTTYSEATGEVTETQTPDGTVGKTPPFSYLSQFGPATGEQGHLSEPRSVAIGSTGNVYVLNTGNNTVDEFTAAGSFIHEFGGTGSGYGQLSSPSQIAVDSKGNPWVADTANNRVEKFNAKGEPQVTFGHEGTGAGEFKEPRGVAVNSAGTVFVSDTGNDRIQKFTEAGVFIEMYGFGVADGQKQFETCKTSCRAGLPGSGNGQFNQARGISITPEGNLWIADYYNYRADEITEAGTYVRSVASNLLSVPNAVATDATGDVYIADTGNNKIRAYSPTGTALWEAGTKGTGPGQFEGPWGLAVTPANHLYIADNKNNRVDHWVPTMLGNPAAHDTQTIYYTPGSEATLPGCQNHAEWAGLPCQEQPAAQPEDGLPPLATTSYTYNIWNQPVTTTDNAGGITRTTTIGYDKSGRTQTAAIVVGSGKPVTITDTYNETNGAIATQTREYEGATKKLSTEVNTLGQGVSYTDADGNTATATYDEDYRPKTLTDAKGSQTYSYSTTTGLPTTLTDPAAGTFTAGYDAEYNMTSQGYPNGMTATYTISPVGAKTSIEYVKTSHCSTNCAWYKQSTVPSIHGETLIQSSNLANAEYAFDETGRITESKTTPAGQGCTTLLYGYELDSNRTSLTTRAPGTGGSCATTGGTTTTSAYDSGERLYEPGIEYDAFANTKTLPAAFAGGNALTSTFYPDNRLASVTQNGETIGYQLDPAERTRETVSTGKTSSSVISHYDGPSESPAWSEEPLNGHWSRNIAGLGNGLEAIQTNNGTSSIQIELTNLHGDVIGTAKDTPESETQLENTTEASEYGVPTVANPPKYSWLGELQRPTELPSGMIAMGARGYIPQLGRFLQTDPSPGSTNNPYNYTNENPINEADPTGEWTTTTSYDYEAATPEQATIPIKGYIEAGAIMPPPADILSRTGSDGDRVSRFFR